MGNPLAERLIRIPGYRIWLVISRKGNVLKYHRSFGKAMRHLLNQLAVERRWS